MNHISNKLEDTVAMILLCLKIHLGQRFWLTPILVLAWPIILAVLLLFDMSPITLNKSSIQNWILGFPLNLLAIGVGIGIIANEIEQRTLEVTYTVSGGTRRIWLFKIVSLALVMLLTEILLAIACFALFSTLPSLGEFYRAFQGAMFLLIFSMGAGALFKTKLMAALMSAAMYISLISMNFDNRWSPLFNPISASSVRDSELAIMTFQNSVGVILVTISLALLSFSRAQRREQLLSD